jgi:hypothetical protein
MFDQFLDRLSKIASIFVPIVIAVIGFRYTAQKDRNDRVQQDMQLQRDNGQHEWDKTQRQYSNLVSLLPALTSHDASAVTLGLRVFTSEANAGQAPLDLRAAIDAIGLDQPSLVPAVNGALAAGRLQALRDSCKASPDGLYVEVVNNADQLTYGSELAQVVRTSTKLPIRTVERVYESPLKTTIRYYVNQEHNQMVRSIKDALATQGLKDVADQNLSKDYLASGCSPPAIYELWIGKSSPLTSGGRVSSP